jgi:putative inorganic carbon (HCO3(-)) transporter
MTLTPVRQRAMSLPMPGILPVAVVVIVAAVAFGFGLYLLALALLVPAVLAILRRPQRGVLLFAALIPFNGLLIVAGAPSFVNGWKEALVGLVFALSLFARPEVRAQPGRRLPSWLPAAVGYLAVGAISAALVLGSQATIGLKINYFDMLLAIAVWRCPLNERERDQLVTIFMIVGFITAVYGIIQQGIGHATLNSYGYPYGDSIRFVAGMRLRSFSTFNQPFPFAFYLMLVILIALPHALSDLGRIRNRLFLLSLPVITLGLFFSYVRGAWLGLGLGLMYLALHRYKWLLLGVPIALVALLFIPSGTISTAAFQSGTFTERTTLWTDKFNQIVSHPWGGGIASTGAAQAKVASKAHTPNAVLLQPDNSYLKTAFELGVIGLWVQILFLISVLVSTRRDERRLERLGRTVDARFVMSFTAQLLAIFAAATVATYFEMVPMQSLFWLMVGITASISADDTTQPEPERSLAAVPSGPPRPTI